jgi:hypothetical protein
VKLGRTVFSNFSFVRNAAIFSPEDGDSIFLRIVSVYLWVYMVSQPRRVSSSRQWEPHICPVCWSKNYLDKTSYYMKPFSCNWFPLGHAMGLFPLKFNANTLPRKSSEVQQHELREVTYGIMPTQNVFNSHLLRHHSTSRLTASVTMGIRSYKSRVFSGGLRLSSIRNSINFYPVIL